MDENLVGLQKYAQEGVEGFGNASYSELAALNKALEAGSITGRDTDGLTNASGAPLKVESLEKTLKVLEFREGDITFWKDIPKIPEYNTVSEYNRLVSYGNDRGGFNTEGELPETEDSVYQRASQLVKFLGVTREVTHPMTLVRTNIGSAIQQEVRNGMMWIMRKADRSLWRGDSDIVPVEYNGMFQQHKEGAPAPTYLQTEKVIDLRGASLSEGNIEEGMRRIVDQFGTANTLYAPPVVISNFVKQFYGDRRTLTPVQDDTRVGYRVSKFMSQFGEVNLKFDKFLNKQPAKNAGASATSAKAPNNVSDGGTPVAAVGSDGSSLWDSGTSGDYGYGVVAFNRYGDSGLHELDSGTPVTVAAGGAVDLQFSDGGGANPATGYRIYRTKKGQTGRYYPLFEITTAELAAGYDGGAATKVRDRNRIIEDTNEAFLFDMDDQILSFKQLAPMMKFDLARVAISYRFSVLLYGTPILYQPIKTIKFINVGG